MAKYLVIAALLALLLLLVYSRLYPYIQAIKKIFGVAKSIVTPQPNSGDFGHPSTRGDKKLVRCVGCGTWVPADRIIGGFRSSAYCSRECIERTSNGKERKIAG